MSQDVTGTEPDDEVGMESIEGEASARLLPQDALLRSVVEPVGSATAERSLGDDVVRIDRSDLAAVAESAKSAGFNMCVDVTAVDYQGVRRTRFEVVVNLLSHQHNRRLRIVTAVPEDDPTVPSLVSVYPGTNFFEREVYDMFGISFEGHPDLTRILMPDDWDGYPLRKDFSVGEVPVQFKESHQVQ